MITQKQAFLIFKSRIKVSNKHLKFKNNWSEIYSYFISKQNKLDLIEIV